MTLAVRTTSSVDTAAALRDLVREIAPSLPIYGLSTLEEQIDAGLVQDRMLATLSMAFGALALLLGCIGLYGTLAYAINRRQIEFGIRLALGATRSGVIAHVLDHSLRPVIAGIALGVAVALAASRVSQSFLFEISGTDPLSYGLAVATLVFSALLAAWLPARRAVRVDPAIALRSQ